MASTPPDEDIEAFWAWFQSVADRLSRDFEQPEILGQLEGRLSTLGQFAWELGPGLDEENSLVISPDGVLDWLPVTQRIVERAPAIEGWEFHSSRPPKKWKLKFRIDDDGRMVEVDARRWNYVLYEVSPSLFDIVVEQSGLRNVTSDTRHAAAVVALDGILGEAARLATIRDIEVVEKLSAADGARSNRMLELGAHWASLELRSREKSDPSA